MTAPLPSARLVRALRLVSVVLVCVLGLFAGAVAARSLSSAPGIAATQSGAVDAVETEAALTVDRAAGDLDEAFEGLTPAPAGASRNGAGPARVGLVRIDRGPDGVGGPLPDRPPRA